MKTVKNQQTAVEPRKNQQTAMEPGKNQQTATEPGKNERKFYRLKDIESGRLNDDPQDFTVWLKSGKFDAPRVSMNVDAESAIGDYFRTIHLHDVRACIQVNSRGYKELHFYGSDGDLPF